jgi:hypothetical protein
MCSLNCVRCMAVKIILERRLINECILCR